MQTNRWLQPGVQPALQEMLDDPIVRSVMRRDGVTRGEVEELVGNLLRRTAGRKIKAEAGARAQPPRVMRRR